MSGRALLGHWDFPWRQGTDVGSFVTRDGRVPCLGWALTSEGLATIDILVDGRRIATIQPTHHREDLEIAFGHTHATAAGLTGWAYAIDAAALPAGRHEITAVARGVGQEFPLGSRTIDVPATSVAERVWDLDPPVLRCPSTRSALRRIADGLQSSDNATYLTRGHQVYFSSYPEAWLTQATSTWGFSPYARDLMREGRRILIVGAGLAPTVPGVVQLDIVDFPNVDVVAGSAELPFADASFDSVICENVIEHVPDPFVLIAEIERVLKPGGRVGVNGTNLHFTHGYPSHFFNATEFGMKYMLETRGSFEGDYSFLDVPASLHTVLAFYVKALPPDARRRVENLTVREFIAAMTSDPSSDVTKLIAGVPDRVRRAISTNIYFAGRKRG
jgi:SAM-dependent methyltransferase